MSVTNANIADYLKKFTPVGATITELNNEGFSDVMIISFVKAAVCTQTIISSRTPGGAGLDLINTGYDLKGFQIKAKSCDWGPMAGFICQLPFLNKAGSAKISYNVGHIAHYLKCLDSFMGPQKLISAFYKNAARKTGFDTANTYIDGLTDADLGKDKLDNVVGTIVLPFANDVLKLIEVMPADSVKAVLETEYDLKIKKQEVKKIVSSCYYRPLRYTVVDYKSAEQTSGEWSGENTIENDTPFIHLKRSFGADITAASTKVSSKKGVTAGSVNSIGNDIYGIAASGTDENPANPTVYVEFLLRRQNDDPESDLWAIYHGDVMYIDPNTNSNPPGPFTPSTADPRPYWKLLKPDEQKNYPIEAIGKVTTDVAERNKKILDTIFSYAPGGPPSIVVDVDSTQAPFSPDDNKTFYPLMGFVNPHPPYKKVANRDKSIAVKLEGQDYYMNAVSGDFDLMAYWNKFGLNENELLRLSEKYLNTNLKYYPNIDQLLCIEFIPGFAEINPSENEILKESTELGNTNSLGNLAAGTLNSYSAQIYKDVYQKTVANKAFHSDEGGRPGVMEIEFPFPFFLPEPFTSTVFNNAYNGTNIPGLATRGTITSYGGLIKTPEELLQLMLECSVNRKMKGKYVVVMQSEWMVHMFYISMGQMDRSDFRIRSTTAFPDIFEEIISSKDANNEPIADPDKLAGREKTITDKIKEFDKIEAEHLAIYQTTAAFDQPTFEGNMKKLLQLNNDADYKTIRNLFLKLAFNNKRKAGLRKMDIEHAFLKIYTASINVEE